MSTAGLRNWRGTIIHPSAVKPVVDQGQRALTAMTGTAGPQSNVDNDNLLAHEATPGASLQDPISERCSASIKVLRKDEFGRDVVEEKRPKEKHKHKHKHNVKEKMHRKSRSQSPRGRLVGTPPPPDPYRPRLDEDRGRRLPRHIYRTSRSRSRSRPKRDRSRYYSRSRSCGHRQRRLGSHRRPARRSSSQSQSRSQRRSIVSHRRRSSASVERQWTHNAFDNRSPSPPRDVNPLYRPEPEAWASRAGGVYLPRT